MNTKYVYVQRKLNDLYDEHFSIFNPPNYSTELKGIFNSVDIKKTVNYIPGVLSVLANKMPAEFIPTINWLLVHDIDPYTPVKRGVPRPPQPIVKHLLIELQFTNDENENSVELAIKVTPDGKTTAETSSLMPELAYNLVHQDVFERAKAMDLFVTELISELQTPEE